MDFIFPALLMLVLGCALTGAMALRPVSAASNRLANIIGPGAASASGLLGLAGLFSGGWTGSENFLTTWGLPFGFFSIGLDPLSKLFLIPVFVLGLTCALSGAISLRHSDPAEHNLGAHWFFYLVLMLGMTCVMTARDGLFFMVSWELMSLSPFFLIDFNDKEQQVQEASWTYLVAAHLGAIMLIAFFALLWQETGSTLFSAMTVRQPVHATLLFFLSLLGFGAKAGFAPLHVWLPEAHPAAPSHVSALLSGAMLNAGLYGIIRSFDFLGDPGELPAWTGWLLMGVGTATAVMGILKALAQSHLKRLLAYSSVENMGLMLLSAGVGLVGVRNNIIPLAALGFTGCIFHMLNHSAFKGLLFLCAGEVLHATGTVKMQMLGGLQKKMPLLGALFALGAASISCLPPFNGFAGEFVISMAMVSGLQLGGLEQKIAMLLCMTGLMLVSGVSAAVYAKAYGMTFLGQPRSRAAEEIHAPENKFLLPLFIPASACVLAGLGAQFAFRMVRQSIAFLHAMPQDMVGSATEAVMQTDSILGVIALYGSSIIATVVILVLVRKALLRRNGLESGPTWGCGYQYGSPRVQYTPASFVEPAARIFAPVMGTTVRMHHEDAWFPGHASLSVKAPDVVRTRFYEPLFEIIERGCNFLKPFQNGLSSMYILYILVTLVLLLVWGIA